MTENFFAPTPVQGASAPTVPQLYCSENPPYANSIIDLSVCYGQNTIGHYQEERPFKNAWSLSTKAQDGDESFPTLYRGMLVETEHPAQVNTAFSSPIHFQMASTPVYQPLYDKGLLESTNTVEFSRPLQSNETTTIYHHMFNINHVPIPKYHPPVVCNTRFTSENHDPSEAANPVQFASSLIPNLESYKEPGPLVWRPYHNLSQE